MLVYIVGFVTAALTAIYYGRKIKKINETHLRELLAYDRAIHNLKKEIDSCVCLDNKEIETKIEKKRTKKTIQ